MKKNMTMHGAWLAGTMILLSGCVSMARFQALESQVSVLEGQGVPALSRKVDQVDTRLAAVDEKADASAAKLQRVGAATGAQDLKRPEAGNGSSGWTAVSACPVGYYVVAVEGYDRDGGKYCRSCMTSFNVICRPFLGPEPEPEPDEPESPAE